ncbi:hypothetical protein JTE90_028224 [Oedothorax gibbosus]|uniref:NAD(P)-binding protein n=1 Tax=Oedothorax gibbosus TaxID=931172 RepID=A0AAV6TUU6_9ARAC|nr:hypothetical protein JTE90_028224 [Oedothorax gibbosus]
MSVLVTGANSGIGLEFVRQLVQLEKYPRYVFAAYRSKGKIKELENIKKSSDRCQVILIQADVTNKEDVKSLRNSIEEIVGDKGLNMLINNAGALRIGSYGKLTEEDMLFHFKTNTVGPVTVFKEMLPLLVKGNESKPNGELFQVKVLNISSMAGSIGDLGEIPLELVESTISYRTSKAALNMAMRSIAIALKDKGILMVNMGPGYVITDKGSTSADVAESVSLTIDVPESVSAMLKTLPTLDQSRHGDFMDRHGRAIAY